MLEVPWTGGCKRTYALIGERPRIARVRPITRAQLRDRARRAGAARGLLHLKKSSPGIAATPSATEPHWVCPEGACEAIAAPTPVKVGNAFALPGASGTLEGGGELGGFDPADLKSAYNIPTGTEGTPTIAIVDAFGYPKAESDLAAYRSKYGLPECTKANSCFKKVNEKGEEGKYPAANAEWEAESALDVDMVSAACPECHIMLVEGSGEAPSQLAASVNEALALGANEVSNSYGYPELYEPLAEPTAANRTTPATSTPAWRSSPRQAPRATRTPTTTPNTGCHSRQTSPLRRPASWRWAEPPCTKAVARVAGTRRSGTKSGAGSAPAAPPRSPSRRGRKTRGARTEPTTTSRPSPPSKRECPYASTATGQCTAAPASPRRWRPGSRRTRARASATWARSRSTTNRVRSST